MKKNEGKINAIKCEEAVKRFNDFIDNYIHGNFRNELGKHISDCKHCFDRFQFEQLLKTKVNQLAENDDKTDVRGKIEKIISSF